MCQRDGTPQGYQQGATHRRQETICKTRKTQRLISPVLAQHQVTPASSFKERLFTQNEKIAKATSAQSGGSTIPRHCLIIPLVLLPILLGGARPWFWSAIAGIFAASMAWSTWFGLPWSWSGSLSKRWLMVLGILLLYPFLQCLPLPASWVALLSPHLMQWKELAGKITQISSGFSSITYEPLVSLFSGFWWVFLAGYALLFRKAVREETSLSWLFSLLFWVAGSEALYGLLQALIPSLGVLWESAGQGLARGTFVNRNHYAAFLGMLWPLLLAYLFCLGSTSPDHRRATSLEQQNQNRQKRWFLGFLIGLMLLALVFSQSRGGIVSALLSLTVFVVFGKKHRRKGMVAFLVGSWGVMLGYGSIIGFEGVLTRFDQLEMDTSGRLKIWGDTLRLIGDHWLTGTGLGTYPEVIRVYQSHLTDQFAIVHAHNDYLELAGDLGVPMALFLTLLVWGYWGECARRLLREAKTGDKEGGAGSLSVVKESLPLDGAQLENRRLIALGALAGGAAFLFQSWVEFNWQIPANQFYFLVLLVLMKV